MSMFLGKDVIEIDHKTKSIKIEKKDCGIEFKWRVLVRKDPYVGEVWNGDGIVLKNNEVKEIIEKLQGMMVL